jgi:hypothetical protein
MNRQNFGVDDKFNYLEVTLESTGEWNKQKTPLKTEEMLGNV